MQVVTGNAACSIAARNAIFKVVPFAFVKPIYSAAKAAAVGDLTTLAERRTKMVAKFESLGVPAKKIFESLGKGGLEEIGLNELEHLIGLYGAIRDGDQTIDEAFPAPKAASEGIKFGASGIRPEERTGNRTAGQHRGQTETSPAHKGRNAAAQAAKTAERTGANEAGTLAVIEADARKTATATPDRATPIQGLRNLIKASPISEPQLVKFLIGNMAMEPSEKLDQLSDDRILKINGSFMDIAGQILEAAGPFGN